MTVDTSKLKTFEDARSAIEELDFDTEDAHTIAQWIWDNCDHNNKDAMYEVWIWADEGSELESLAYHAYRG